MELRTFVQLIKDLKYKKENLEHIDIYKKRDRRIIVEKDEETNEITITFLDVNTAIGKFQYIDDKGFMIVLEMLKELLNETKNSD